MSDPPKDRTPQPSAYELYRGKKLPGRTPEEAERIRSQGYYDGLFRPKEEQLKDTNQGDQPTRPWEGQDIPFGGGPASSVGAAAEHTDKRQVSWGHIDYKVGTKTASSSVAGTINEEEKTSRREDEWGRIVAGVGTRAVPSSVAPTLGKKERREK